jgi:transcriptional regulator NrdR family protein
LQKKSNQVWRRRQCTGCTGVFTTHESIDLPSSLLYKRDEKHTEPFQRDKLFISVYEACKHRKDATQAATALTDTVLTKLRALIDNATIERSAVIGVTSVVLKHFDKAALAHYNAYHPL